MCTHTLTLTQTHTHTYRNITLRNCLHSSNVYCVVISTHTHTHTRTDTHQSMHWAPAESVQQQSHRRRRVGHRRCGVTCSTGLCGERPAAHSHIPSALQALSTTPASPSAPFTPVFYPVLTNLNAALDMNPSCASVYRVSVFVSFFCCVFVCVRVCVFA